MISNNLFFNLDISVSSSGGSASGQEQTAEQLAMSVVETVLSTPSVSALTTRTTAEVPSCVTPFQPIPQVTPTAPV